MKLPTYLLDSLNLADFVRDHIEPELPALIRGVQVCGAQETTKESIVQTFKVESRRRVGFYDSPIEPQLTPQMAQDIMSSKDFGIRPMPMRVFMHKKGHKTLGHYDGNSIHGLNLQVKGRKHWHIYSPKSSLRFLPFMYVVMDDLARYRNQPGKHFEFIAEEGDLLFLPRYWVHEVESLGQLNINLNWVFTPRTPSGSRLGVREQQIVKLRQSLPLINSAYFPDEIEGYGSIGQDVKRYTDQVTQVDLLKRLAYEASSYARLPAYYSRLREAADDFEKNNFNV